MTDTLFADVSEFQTYVSDAYPYEIFSFRSNDGTYRDKKFFHNYAWAKSAADRGKIDAFLVYLVWEPNWQQTIQTFFSMVGTPHPKMVVMIDVESWGGRISGNQSAGINAAREAIIKWLGGNRDRVIGYGNQGDLNSLWPTRGDAHVVLAAYGSNPGFSGKIAHQFADNFNTAPFGPCDINSADGVTPEQFAGILGLGVHPHPAPAGKAPIGHVDLVKAYGNVVRLAGWAYDPDSPTASIRVLIYQDGKAMSSISANKARPDVNTVLKNKGNYGFDVAFVSPPGVHTYTVHALNVGPAGTNTPLGGGKVVVATSAPKPPAPKPPAPKPPVVPTPAPTAKPPTTPIPAAKVSLTEGQDMIIVEIDTASVPTGIAWPGVFLVGPNFVHHITGATANPNKTITNNVTGYIGAGLKYGKISYAEFVQLKSTISATQNAQAAAIAAAIKAT